MPVWLAQEGFLYPVWLEIVLVAFSVLLVTEGVWWQLSTVVDRLLGRGPAEYPPGGNVDY